MASTLWSAFIVVMHLIPFFLTAAADLQEISETVRAISGMVTARNALKNMARPEGFEPPTYGFVVIGRRVSGIARGAAKIAAPPYFIRPSARLATSGWWYPVEGFGAVLDTVWARGGHVPAGSTPGSHREG